VSRTSVALAAALVLLATVAAGFALFRDDDSPAPGLTIDWGGSEGRPACTYDPGTGTVSAELTIEGRASRHRNVTLTVTAYADENTSEPVGASSRTVRVEGDVHRRVRFTIPVEKAPHVGEDDVAACSRSMTY
jgi:hypothetical protein